MGEPEYKLPGRPVGSCMQGTAADQGNSHRQVALAHTPLCGATVAVVVVTLQMHQMTCPTATPLPRLGSQGRSTMSLSPRYPPQDVLRGRPAGVKAGRRPQPLSNPTERGGGWAPHPMPISHLRFCHARDWLGPTFDSAKFDLGGGVSLRGVLPGGRTRSPHVADNGMVGLASADGSDLARVLAPQVARLKTLRCPLGLSRFLLPGAELDQFEHHVVGGRHDKCVSAAAAPSSAIGHLLHTAQNSFSRARATRICDRVAQTGRLSTIQSAGFASSSHKSPLYRRAVEQASDQPSPE